MFVVQHQRWIPLNELAVGLDLDWSENGWISGYCCCRERMINDGICGYLILRQTRVTIFWIGTVAKPWGQVLGAKKNGTKRQELHFGMEKITCLPQTLRKSASPSGALPYQSCWFDLSSCLRSHILGFKFKWFHPFAERHTLRTDYADLGYDFARASEMGIVIVGPSDVRLPSFSCDAVELSRHRKYTGGQGWIETKTKHGP